MRDMQPSAARRADLSTRDMSLVEHSRRKSESLEAFIQMDKLRQQEQGLSDEAIFTAAVFKFRGDALLQYQLCDSNNRFRVCNLSVLDNALLERFDGDCTSDIALPELLRDVGQEKGESTADFETRFRLAYSHAQRASPGLLTDKWVLEIFKASVLDDYLLRITDKQPRTFEEAVAIFRE